MRILFCNAGWMEEYRGQLAGEDLIGGGDYVSKHGQGLEVCNFLPHAGTVYGFVKVPQNGKLNLEKIAGADKGELADHKHIKDVLIVWTAPLRGHGPRVVVGWYSNATVYRSYQQFDTAPPRHERSGVGGYRFTAKSGDAVLLPIDARTFVIPKSRKGEKGLAGQANIWYADKPPGEAVVQRVHEWIENWSRRNPARNVTTRPRRRINDPEHNAKVEVAAVGQVREYLSELGYDVRSVERDNVGWDLEAKLEGKVCLRVEVKGLSGKVPRVGLTPNEFEAFKDGVKGYRLAIVTGAVSESPKLRVCRFSDERGQWLVDGQDGCEVQIEERTGAIVRVSGK